MMTLNRTHPTILILILCSALLLVAVLFFEYRLGLLPCRLCIWQRFPHLAAILLGSFALINNSHKLVMCLGSFLAILSGFILAGYHAGIEYKFWSGPKSCSGNNVPTSLTPEKFLETILKVPTVRCDEVAWSFFNISMAGWNFLISFFLLISWSLVILKVFKDSRY